jgi:hypothetical protein
MMEINSSELGIINQFMTNKTLKAKNLKQAIFKELILILEAKIEEIVVSG